MRGTRAEGSPPCAPTIARRPRDQAGRERGPRGCGGASVRSRSGRADHSAPDNIRHGCRPCYPASSPISGLFLQHVMATAIIGASATKLQPEKTNGSTTRAPSYRRKGRCASGGSGMARRPGVSRTHANASRYQKTMWNDAKTKIRASLAESTCTPSYRPTISGPTHAARVNLPENWDNNKPQQIKRDRVGQASSLKENHSCIPRHPRGHRREGTTRS